LVTDGGTQPRASWSGTIRLDQRAVLVETPVKRSLSELCQGATEGARVEVYGVVCGPRSESEEVLDAIRSIDRSGIA